MGEPAKPSSSSSAIIVTFRNRTDRKYSGRVGRSAAAKALDAEAVRLAVAAHVRHGEANYDELLASGADRHEAREHVARQVDEVLRRWQVA